jgi:hypothetical protein
MNEDYMLDEEFLVESNRNLLEECSQNEYDTYILKTYLKPCCNCGEFVSKENLVNGECYLCRKSEFHNEKRGTSNNTNNNIGNIKGFIDEHWD